LNKKLQYFVDDRGYSLFDIFSDLRELDDVAGQINLSGLDSGVVKAFHLHKWQDDLVVCLKGRVMLITAAKDGSDVEKTILSEKSPQVIYIPAGRWHGYKALDDGTIILYHCTQQFDKDSPDENRAPWDMLGKEIWDIDFK
jgi:dTDP-4-dehydrorhamnose 3,5-epimerase